MLKLKPSLCKMKIKNVVEFKFLKKEEINEMYPAWIFIMASIIILFPFIFLLKKYFYFIIPPCSFKEITHIPCPTCGFTRMLFFILDFRLKEAFLIQPFFFILFLMVIIWVAIGLFSYILFGRFFFIYINKKFEKVFLWGMIFLFVVNYIYLIFSGV